MNLSKQFTRREKVLMAILAVLMVVAAYFLAIHRPVTEALSDAALRTQEAEDQILLLEAMLTRQTEMEAELETIRKEGGVVEIPAYDNLQRVMVFLNTTLAATTDYNLSFQPVTLPTEGSIVRRVIAMRFQCADYDAARTVLTTLHDGAYRCQLGDMTIVPILDSAAAPVVPVVPADPADPEAPQGPGLRQNPVQVALAITFYEIIR